MHSCWWGMRPGREPHRNNNNPHQRSSTRGIWLSTFILWVYESSLRHSITHRNGEEEEKKGWFSKYKLTTNWSLTPHVFFSILLNISLFLFISIYLNPYTVDAPASPLRDSHHNHSSQSLINPSDPPHHITASWFQSHCSHSAQWVLYLQQLLNLKILNQCDRLVPACLAHLYSGVSYISRNTFCVGVDVSLSKITFWNQNLFEVQNSFKIGFPCFKLKL